MIKYLNYDELHVILEFCEAKYPESIFRVSIEILAFASVTNNKVGSMKIE